MIGCTQQISVLFATVKPRPVLILKRQQASWSWRREPHFSLS